MHNNEFFIEKRRLPVEVELVSGERLGGDLFIQSSWRGPSILEDAPEYMNANEPFFPLQLADGSTRLIARRHVLVLKAPPPDYERNEEQLGDPVTVSIQMSNGSTIRGTLFVEAMSPRARVLDYLNRVHDAFLILHDSSGDLVVNRSHIISLVEERDGTD
jgi:hypothetical protein